MHVVESAAAEEFFRRPRSKRRRILKKWQKRRQNNRPAMFYSKAYGGKLIVHPYLVPQLERIAREVASAEEPMCGGDKINLRTVFGPFGGLTAREPTPNYLKIDCPYREWKGALWSTMV